MKSTLKGITSQLPKSAISPQVSPERINPLTTIDPKHATIKFADAGHLELEQPPHANTVRIRPGMSNAVMAANEDLNEAEQQMKDLEKKRIDKMKELEEIDCAEMLKSAGVKIKVMNQLLDRLIPSDDSHTVIVENKTYGIEVIPGNLMTFRVPVKNAYPPMRFTITYNDSDKNGVKTKGRANRNLKVFVD